MKFIGVGLKCIILKDKQCGGDTVKSDFPVQMFWKMLT